MNNNCPALFIAAPASGQGKTTFTAALARYHRNQGRKVRVFKTGPDFLDPMILEVASGHPVYQLDLWMNGEADCKRRLYEAAAEADLILLEGVMGLFDGKSSSADLAQAYGIPIAALIDASGMAQTFGAIAYGLAHYRPGLAFSGVIANRVASPGHAEMLAESLQDVTLLASLMRDDAITLPERHLGLVQAAELGDLEQRLDQAATQIAATALADLPPQVEFSSAPSLTLEPLLQGQRIGIARDAAFAFIYPANIDVLEAMGAELAYFSPLHDSRLPEVDSLWLPGGYPELHLQTLADNQSMAQDIRQHFEQGKPILAECGGMLYLTERLTDKQGDTAKMIGLLQGEATMQPRLTALGMQSVDLGAGEIHGHTFHHSLFNSEMAAQHHGIRQRGKQPGEAVYQIHGLTASYLHQYFPSNPQAVAGLFLKM
ncbi:MAG: cobyrinate a,c-diamide synthase [Gammaproteobacteria bacterium]|nr:cobyrinate a,c-diamide synthase [Gammaproteobacteria bacterium]